jgi:hypothetical protein
VGTDSVTPLRVDEERIERRAVQLTRGSSGASAFFLSRDGRTIYFTVGAAAGPAAVRRAPPPTTIRRTGCTRSGSTARTGAASRAAPSRA